MSISGHVRACAMSAPYNWLLSLNIVCHTHTHMHAAATHLWPTERLSVVNEICYALAGITQFISANFVKALNFSSQCCSKMLRTQLLLLLLPALGLGRLNSSEVKPILNIDGLTWRQQIYYQSRCKHEHKELMIDWSFNSCLLLQFTGPQRKRFITTPEPGATPDPPEMRKVYPCYCYMPPQPGRNTTEAYEEYMVESKNVFILNK